MKSRFFNLSILALVILQLVIGTSLQAQREGGGGNDGGQTMTKDQARNAFAQTLSRAMMNSSVRNFLKTQAVLQFDQDYDILYENVKNLQVAPGQTFASILAGYGAGNLMTTATFFSTDLCAIEPTLQISIPELANGSSADTWNTAAVIPVVAVVETTFDPGTATYVKAYNNSGTLINLSSTTDPTTLTAVVGISERVVAVNPATGRTTDDVAFGDISGGYQAYLLGRCFDFYVRILTTPPPPPPSGTGPTAGTCQRDTKTTKDELYQVTMNSQIDMNWAEHWTSGKLELDAHVLFAGSGLSSTGLSEIVKSFSLKRTYHTNDWKTLELEIFHWLEATNGDKMIYHWVEVDKNSFEVSVPVSLTVKIFGQAINLGFTLKWSNKDEDCGGSVIEYCDTANTPGSTYNTGRVKFKVRQRD